MEYKEWLRGIKGYSEKTIGTYSKYVFEFEVLGADVDKYIGRYQHKSNSTKRLAISALKNYLAFIGDKRSKLLELPKKDIVVSDFVTYEQYKKYLSKININTKMGYQKYLIVRILFETGIRSSELLWITKTSVQGNRIKIQGKGNKQRYIVLSKWLESDLNRYLSTISSERLFEFTYKNLYQKIRLLDRERNLTPHMFRHGYAKYCFEKGISIYDISLSMGHSSIDTTATYINKKSEDVSIFTIF